MKNLTVLLFCLFANLIFGQTKFDNEKLMLVQDIYNNSAKNKINSFMEGKGYTVAEVEKNEEEGTLTVLNLNLTAYRFYIFQQVKLKVLLCFMQEHSIMPL